VFFPRLARQRQRISCCLCALDAHFLATRDRVALVGE
jgi:hypothetical protein